VALFSFFIRFKERELVSRKSISILVCACENAVSGLYTFVFGRPSETNNKGSLCYMTFSMVLLYHLESKLIF